MGRRKKKLQAHSEPSKEDYEMAKKVHSLIHEIGLNEIGKKLGIPPEKVFFYFIAFDEVRRNKET